MLLGILLHNYIGAVGFLTQYLIFLMLYITYSKLDFRHFRPGRYVWMLLGAQILGSILVYLLLRPFSNLLAQGAFLCVFCPTATAAPVITSMLGGRLERVATYSLFSNFAVALLAPALLTIMDGGSDLDPQEFSAAILHIGKTVLPIILLPLLFSYLTRICVPRFHGFVAHHPGVSFYLWAVSLIIVVGNAVSFVFKEPASMIPEIIGLALISLIMCLLQFYIGRQIGKRTGDPISGAQSLGQKNTVLAIWLALSYMQPIISIAPAAYIAWHNSVNSYQLFRHEKNSHHCTR